MPGFDFSHHNRNAALHAQGVPLPKATSTGTTIVGCIFDGGVVVCSTEYGIFCKIGAAQGYVTPGEKSEI